MIGPVRVFEGWHGTLVQATLWFAGGHRPGKRSSRLGRPMQFSRGRQALKPSGGSPEAVVAGRAGEYRNISEVIGSA